MKMPTCPRPPKNNNSTWTAVGLLALSLALSACTPAPQPRGFDLGGTPAPSFQLADQDGNLVSLSDLRGKVVALTFLFTQCVETCPLTVEKFRQTADQLGGDAESVAFVAISLDPEGDTPARVSEFLAAHQMTGRMLYLGGPREGLEPIWKSYFLFVATPAPTPGHDMAAMIGHTDAIMLLDRDGGQRVNLHSDVTIEDLVYDLRLLLEQ